MNSVAFVTLVSELCPPKETLTFALREEMEESEFKNKLYECSQSRTVVWDQIWHTLLLTRGECEDDLQKTSSNVTNKKEGRFYGFFGTVIVAEAVAVFPDASVAV